VEFFLKKDIPAEHPDIDEKAPGFKREIGLFDATMLVIGSMIGSGIFIVSADIARTVGSGGLLMLVWLITGIITLIGALSYGELAAMMPKAGGQYIYLREAYNPLIGFLYGWTLFLIIQTGMIAAVAVAFARFTAIIIPWLGNNNILIDTVFLKISAGQLFAIISIALLTYINIKGLKEGKIVQNIFTVTKVAVLLALIILAVTLGSNIDAVTTNLENLWKGEWIHMSGGKIDWIESLSGTALIAAIGAAMVGSLFSSDAWNNVTFTAGETKNPRRNIPLSLFLGTLTVTILYLLVNISYLMVLPLKGDPGASDVFGQGMQFAAEDRIGTAAAYMFLGEAAAMVMAVLIMVSTFGCNNGLILMGARVYYAMAKDNLFFSAAGRLNKSSVPAKALLFQGIWAGILCLSGTYSELLDYVIFAVLIFYILTITGLFILRRKHPGAERPYKAFGYPFLPVIYIILASAICIILLLYKPEFTWRGLIIVLLGIPVYFLWNKRRMTKG
jgi:basic amino acid/polyamine antiporter, APA family